MCGWISKATPNNNRLMFAALASHRHGGEGAVRQSKRFGYFRALAKDDGVLSGDGSEQCRKQEILTTDEGDEHRYSERDRALGGLLRGLRESPASVVKISFSCGLPPGEWSARCFTRHDADGTVRRTQSCYCPTKHEAVIVGRRLSPLLHRVTCQPPPLVTMPVAPTRACRQPGRRPSAGCPSNGIPG